MRRSFYTSKRVEMDRLEEEEVGGCGVAENEPGWVEGMAEWRSTGGLN